MRLWEIRTTAGDTFYTHSLMEREVVYCTDSAAKPTTALAYHVADLPAMPVALERKRFLAAKAITEGKTHVALIYGIASIEAVEAGPPTWPEKT